MAPRVTRKSECREESTHHTRHIMVGASLMTWGHMIWIFFPIPVFCLILLSILPSRRRDNSDGAGCNYYMARRYRKFEQWGTDVVGTIFFTPVSFGHMSIQLITFFSVSSLLIFILATRSVTIGFHSSTIAPCTGMTTCSYHSGETLWYRKASRYRAERNFWLSLFTLVLWLLVYLIYTLKREIVHLRTAATTSAIVAEDGAGKKEK